jgi:hypothetical protein
MRFSDFALDLELFSLLCLFGSVPNHGFMFFMILAIILVRHFRYILKLHTKAACYIWAIFFIPILKSTMFGPNAYDQAECSKNLRQAVLRGTQGNCGVSGEFNAVHAVCDILKQKPQLVPDAVSIMRERIADNCVTTSYMGLDLLDRCMRANGLEFHFYVTKRALDQVLRLAIPSSATHPQVQRKAAALIAEWEATFRSDSRLRSFSDAAMELARQSAAASCKKRPVRAAAAEVQDNRRLSTLSTTELIALAKMSQRAILAQIRAADNPARQQELTELYDQLTNDLADYYARADASTTCGGAAAVTAAACCPLPILS